MPEIFESASLIKNQIAALIEEHRDLDGVIAVLDSSKQSDDLRIRRLKKRKLLLLFYRLVSPENFSHSWY